MDFYRDRSRLIGVGVVVGFWLASNWGLWLIGSLMSIDEDWEGWSDLLLNPYLMTPYALFTIGTALIVRVIVRKPDAGDGLSRR